MYGPHSREILGGRYEIGPEIGRGGHGVVYRAYDHEVHEEVAIKILKPDVAADRQYAVRLWREAQYLAALWGSAVVEVKAFDYDARGSVYMVMELLHGDTLEDHLFELEGFNDRMSAFKLLTTLDPVAKALHLGHFMGIIHRDVKPPNIFIVDEDAGGGTRLMDFGLAKTWDAEDITDHGLIAGSPSYISPEVWRSEDFDHRADVYSFAAVIFRALCGRPPFVAANTLELYEVATTAPRPRITEFRPDLPYEIDEWARYALALHADDRYQDVTSMWNDLLSLIMRGDSQSAEKAREAFRLPSFPDPVD
jgi:serine/threonine protein kinase